MNAFADNVIAGETDSTLMAEAAVLLAYVGDRRPSEPAMRLYADELARRHARPLRLPSVCRRWPSVLRLIEPPFGGGAAGMLRERLHLCAVIVEHAADGTPRFHEYTDRPRWLRLLRLTMVMATEVMILPVRMIALWTIWSRT